MTVNIYHVRGPAFNQEYTPFRHLNIRYNTDSTQREPIVIPFETIAEEPKKLKKKLKIKKPKILLIDLKSKTKTNKENEYAKKLKTDILRLE